MVAGPGCYGQPSGGLAGRVPPRVWLRGGVWLASGTWWLRRFGGEAGDGLRFCVGEADRGGGEVVPEVVRA